MTPVDYRGQTTLITGASAGLGVEFARQLAARGSGLVLVARRRDRLEALAAELSGRHGVAVTPIAMDLGRPAPGEALAAEVDRLGLTVTGLINNAGFGMYGPFRGEDPARLREMLNLNVTALTDLSRAFIERLQAYGEGVLVNVASTAAYQPVPDMAAYAATKAFVLSFTEALWYECRTGPRVLCLSPGPAETEFFEVVGDDRADGGTPRHTAAEVVATALRALDRRTPPPSVVVGRRNHLRATSLRLFTRRRAVMAVAWSR